jgi:hypothetical protein
VQGLSLMKNSLMKTNYSWFPHKDLTGVILGDPFTANEIAKEEEDKIAIITRMNEMAEVGQA